MSRRFAHFLCFCLAGASSLPAADPGPSIEPPAPQADAPAPRPMTPPRFVTAPRRGLAWLAGQQNVDGSWGDEQQSFLTALVLRAHFLHGEFSDSRDYGVAVRKGLDWLIAFAQAHEGLLTADPKFTGESRFDHAVGTCALAESIQRNDGPAPALAALRDAVQQIIRTQNKDGGWSAAQKPSGEDFRLTAWNLNALRAAHLASLKWFAMENARANGDRWLAAHELPDGQYGYTGAQRLDGQVTGGPRALGPCVVARLGLDATHQDVVKTIDWMLSDLEKHAPWKYDAPDASLEAWASQQEAMVFYGGASWNRWNRAVTDPIVNAQSPAGSWPPPNGGPASGLQAAQTKSGAIYRTAWAIQLCEPIRRRSQFPMDNR